MTRTTRLHLESLEGRDVPAVTVSTPGEAFAWVLINDMRQDPAGFANQLDGLRRGTRDSAFGYGKNDPVVRDLKRLINYSAYPGRYQQALQMLRAAPPVGALGWDDVLEDRAAGHTEWMKTHAFEHTGQDHPDKQYVAGFRTGYNGGSPDDWGYEPGRYNWWGENIGYTYGLLANSKTAFTAGTFGQVAFYERAAFIDTVSYILEVNSPNMAHLKQLLRPDGGPNTGGPQFNAIGMDIQSYEGPYEVRDRIGEATVSTHRLGMYGGGSGGFLSGIVYKDANGNGYFDAGEGIGATLRFVGPSTFTETVDRLGSHGVASNFVPNGTYTVAATAADGTPLGTRTVAINNRNGWFEFRQTGSAAPRAAALLTAPTGTSGVRPTVTWTPVAGAVGYLVRLTDSTTGQFNVFPGATALGASWTPPRDLVPGRTYQAAVRPLFAESDGVWGPAGTFQVGQPQLNGPSGTIATPAPAFHWTPVAGATRYVLVLTDLTAGRRVATVRTTGTSWTLPTDLTNGHTYRWKVAAKNADNLGKWTLPQEFRVEL